MAVGPRTSGRALDPDGGGVRLARAWLRRMHDGAGRSSTDSTRCRLAAALSFALASPALNPIVMIATATAFAGWPSMVLARFAASFLSALTEVSISISESQDPALVSKSASKVLPQWVGRPACAIAG